VRNKNIEMSAPVVVLPKRSLNQKTNTYVEKVLHFRETVFQGTHVDRQHHTDSHRIFPIITACMDGRAQTAEALGFPFGNYAKFRNAGELKPDFSHFMDSLISVTERNTKHGSVLFIPSFHFSSSNEHLGCKGFDYSIENAISAKVREKDLFTEMYGMNKHC
jgi:hypothetical protein